MIKAKNTSNEYVDIIKVFAGSDVQKEILKIWSTEANAFVFEATAELTAPLPLTITTDGTALIDYRIYGNTVDGESVGVQTESGEPAGYKLPMVSRGESLFDVELEQGGWSGTNGQVPYKKGPNDMALYPIRVGSTSVIPIGIPEKTYTVSVFPSNLYIACTIVNASGKRTGDTGWNKTNAQIITGAYGICVTIRNSTNTALSVSEVQGVVVTEGSTAPASYIPYYREETPIYIGDTKLAKDEYVSYREQKVYKYRVPENTDNTVIYGFHVNPDESNPADAVTYLEDAVGMTPAAMGSTAFNYGSWANAFFMPKPCMLKFDGTVDYYLDPNDYSKKADGTASDVSDSTYEGNAMMEWPLIWWKYEPGTEDGEGYFFCSNRKVDDTYKCWCNIDSKNQIIDHFYTAIYNGTGTDKLRSISGVQLTSANGSENTSGTTEINRALANNTTEDVEWYTDVWADRMLINGLLILIGKSLDSQGVFGRGIESGGQTSKGAYVTGTLDDKGLFYGNISGSSTAVKVFGMENWWGLVWRRTAGLVGLANGTAAVKMTYGTADGTTVEGYNTTGNGYYIDTNIRPSSGYVSKVRFNALGFYLPITIGASTTTKWCDYWSNNNSALTYALVGGSSSVGASGGFSYFYLGYGVSSASWGISAALSCKPLAKCIPTDPPVPLPALPTTKGETTFEYGGGEPQPEQMYVKYNRIK